MGYYSKFESTSERFDGPLIYTGLLFLVNIVFFMFFNIAYFENPSNLNLLRDILTSMMVIAFFNFNTLGNLIGIIRGVS